MDKNETFVSDSPYIYSFDGLESIHYQIDRNQLITSLEKKSYKNIFEKIDDLPNGKQFIRLDFTSDN